MTIDIWKKNSASSEVSPMNYADEQRKIILKTELLKA